MDRIRTTAVAALATGALTVGLVLPAVAQDDDTATEDATGGAVHEHGQDRHAARHAAFVAALAGELGLDVDTVSDALDAVRDQLHADQEAGDGNVLPFRDGRGGRHRDGEHAGRPGHDGHGAGDGAPDPAA
jgi:hypothetical protein